MTLFYPLGNMSPWRDNELRYSIRSFNPDHVVVIGHKPAWYTGEHHPFTIGKWSKPQDIFLKTRRMAELYDEFIFANDDHFLLESLTSLPQYHEGPIAKFKGGSETFMRYVSNTVRYHPGGMYFDIHTPLRIESAKFLTLTYSDDVVMKSRYCNTFPDDWQYMKDLKINHHVRTEDIERLVEGRQFMSIGDNGLSSDMRKWLADKFPNPSRWELAGNL